MELLLYPWWIQVIIIKNSLSHLWLWNLVNYFVISQECSKPTNWTNQWHLSSLGMLFGELLRLFKCYYEEPFNGTHYTLSICLNFHPHSRLVLWSHTFDESVEIKGLLNGVDHNLVHWEFMKKYWIMWSCRWFTIDNSLSFGMFYCPTNDWSDQKEVNINSNWHIIWSIYVVSSVEIFDR